MANAQAIPKICWNSSDISYIDKSASNDNDKINSSSASDNSYTDSSFIFCGDSKSNYNQISDSVRSNIDNNESSDIDSSGNN